MKSVTEKIEESLIENQRFIEAMESHANSKNGNLFDLPPFSMEIETGLVRPCEPVTIHLRATAAEIPQGSLTVEADYLGPNPGRPEVLNIAWHPDGPGKWRAEYVLTPSRPGNWRVKWEQPQFWLTRIFGVVADNELVVTLWVGSNIPRIDTEIHAHSLPGDTWVPELFNITRDPEKFIGELSAQAHDAWRYGDRLVPFCNSNQLLPLLADWNLFKLPAESQRQAFLQVQELWLAMGLKPLEIIGSYTPGHATPGILQGLGIKALNSLCIWQDFEDGDSWQINHISPPISPYFTIQKISERSRQARDWCFLPWEILIPPEFMTASASAESPATVSGHCAIRNIRGRAPMCSDFTQFLMAGSEIAKTTKTRSLSRSAWRTSVKTLNGNSQTRPVSNIPFDAPERAGSSLPLPPTWPTIFTGILKSNPNR